MWLKTLSGASLVALIATGCSHGQDENTMRRFSSPLDAVQYLRDDLRTLGESSGESDSEEYAKALGFASAQEAATADLGSSVHIYRVDVLLLEDFKSGSDPNFLLIDMHNMLFPLVVKGQPRTTIYLSERGQREDQKNAWHITRKGPTSLAEKVYQYRTASSEFLVEIAEAPLEMRFLGHQKLMLTPLADNPELGFKEGVEMSAETVFEQLAPLAKEAKKREADKKKRDRSRKNTSLTP